eukprot:4551730-Alexandrium_andersonii.AAC.1
MRAIGTQAHERMRPPATLTHNQPLRKQFQTAQNCTVACRSCPREAQQMSPALKPAQIDKLRLTTPSSSQ